MGKSEFKLGEATLGKVPCICFPLDYAATVLGVAEVIDRATILADATAYFDAQGFVLPAGCVLDLATVKVGSYGKGAQVIPEGATEKIAVDGFYCATVTDATNPLVVNPGGWEDFGVDPADDDCDQKADTALSSDFQVEVEGAVRLNVCVSYFAAP